MGAGSEILTALARIEAKVDRLLGTTVPTQRAPAATVGATVADAADLDGQYGNPEVKFSPKRWTGIDCKGRKFSDCPADFLESLAETLQYFSEHPKPGKEKYADYDARDAARARGWAARNRALDPTPADTPDSLGEERLPF
jgi:hypothetical protein